jgi:hypothetical protein
MSSDDSIAHDQSSRRPMLGVLWLVYGVIRLVAAFWLFFMLATATVMFGALLVRVPDPFTLMSAFHFIYAVMIIWSSACGFFGLLAGLALLSGWRSARTLALVAGFLALPNLPLGTILGIYTLVVFLPSGAGPVYGRSLASH